MKRLYLIALIGVVVMSSGCDFSVPESYDTLKSRQAVVAEFDTPDVVEIVIYQRETYFLVRPKDGSLWRVYTNENKVSTKTQIFAPIPSLVTP